FEYPESIKRDLIGSYLDEIRKAEVPDLKARIEQLIDTEIAHVRAKKLAAEQERSEIDSLSDTKRFAEEAATTAKSSLDAATDEQRTFAANYLSNPRTAGRRPDAQEAKLLTAVTPATQAVALAHAFPDEWTRKAEEQARRSGAWIHTPVIVLSRTREEL